MATRREGRGGNENIPAHGPQSRFRYTNARNAISVYVIHHVSKSNASTSSKRRLGIPQSSTLKTSQHRLHLGHFPSSPRPYPLPSKASLTTHNRTRVLVNAMRRKTSGGACYAPTLSPKTGTTFGRTSRRP